MIWGGWIFHDDKDARCRLLEGSISCPKKHIKLTARLRWWFFESFFYLLSPQKLRKMNPSWLIFFWKTNVWRRPTGGEINIFHSRYPEKAPEFVSCFESLLNFLHPFNIDIPTRWLCSNFQPQQENNSPSAASGGRMW